MHTLRANNFDTLLDIYSEIKNLVKRCNGVIRSALSKISRKLYNITNWQASNEAYWEYLGYAATRLNILYNSSFDESTKGIIRKIYNKITAILPEEFQLLLFAEDSDFGWNFKINLSDFATKVIRYVPNKFWDTLKKLFPSMRSKVQPMLSTESEYIQMSLNFEV
ncbi:MAG TPA: hypothetical protein V6D26_09655 [Stenomitos sp.]